MGFLVFIGVIGGGCAADYLGGGPVFQQMWCKLGKHFVNNEGFCRHCFISLKGLPNNVISFKKARQRYKNKN